MKDRGCQWNGKLEQLDTHLEVETGDCEYVDIECPEKCGQQIQKRQLAPTLLMSVPSVISTANIAASRPHMRLLAVSIFKCVKATLFHAPMVPSVTLEF